MEEYADGRDGGAAERIGPHRLAVEALMLRRWAIGLLCAHEEPGAAPRVPEAAWDFFLRMEWFALPLCHRLGPGDGLDDVARRALARAVALEQGRVRAAREEIARLGAMAGERGWRLVVLKGGVAVAGGLDLHVEDVDLVGTAADANAIMGALRAEDRSVVSGKDQHRLGARDEAGVPLEVHTGVQGLGPGDALVHDAVALEGGSGLLRLPGPVHLWHVLLHGVAAHPDRVARLRDVMLVRSALDLCTIEEQRAVEQRAAGRPEASQMAAVLRLARREGPTEAVERYVRRRYFLIARWRWMGHAPVARHRFRQILTGGSLLTVPTWRQQVRDYLAPAPSRAAKPASRRGFARRAAAGLRLAGTLARLSAIGVGAVFIALAANVEERLSGAASPTPRSR